MFTLSESPALPQTQNPQPFHRYHPFPPIQDLSNVAWETRLFSLIGVFSYLDVLQLPNIWIAPNPPAAGTKFVVGHTSYPPPRRHERTNVSDANGKSLKTGSLSEPKHHYKRFLSRCNLLCGICNLVEDLYQLSGKSKQI